MRGTLVANVRTPLALRIRAARLEAGLSQRRLAERVGTHRRHVIKWENGEVAPGADYVARLAKATGQPPGVFEKDGDEDEEESELASELFTAVRRIMRAEAKRARKGVPEGKRA